MGLGNLLERGKKWVVQLFIALNQLRTYWFIILNETLFLKNSASKKQDRRNECKVNIKGIAS
jgi:hypothetical protein